MEQNEYLTLSEDGKTVVKCDRGFEGAVEIPEGVTTIEEFSFYGCYLITSVKIPSSVTKIGRSAFEGCTCLTSIEIQNKATKITNDAFEDCNNLKLPENWKKYPISTTAYLGFAYSGDVTEDGEGFVILSDEDVRQLVTLIRENDGETDVEALDIENKMPDLYELLKKACYDAAWKAAYYHAVIEAYEEGDYEVTDEVLESWERDYGYEYWEDDEEDEEDNDEEENSDTDYYYGEEPESPEAQQFRDWLDSEVEGMNDLEKAQFLSKVLDSDLVNTDGISPDFTVTIPKEIIEMAKSE